MHIVDMVILAYLLVRGLQHRLRESLLFGILLLHLPEGRDEGEETVLRRYF
jgi:hypothetical protein